MTFWDGYNVYKNILDDPHSFGFDDSTSTCRGDCFWNDDFHPSEKAQKLFAQDISEAMRVIEYVVIYIIAIPEGHSHLSMSARLQDGTG